MRKNIYSIFPKAFLLCVWLFAVVIAANVSSAQTLKQICPNLNQDPCAKAKNVIAAADVIVYGEEPKGSDWTYTAEAMLTSPDIGVDKFKEGVKLKEAVEFAKERAASAASGEGAKIFIVRRAFDEVYGSMPLVQQEAEWVGKIKQKKAWYAIIVLDENARLMNDANLRRQMIDRSYSFATGKSAKPEDAAKWMKANYHFRQIFTQLRSYLYSPEGAPDLHDTVRRALYVINKKEPSETEIKSASDKFKPGKKVYREMLGKKLPFDF